MVRAEVLETSSRASKTRLRACARPNAMLKEWAPWWSVIPRLGPLRATREIPSFLHPHRMLFRRLNAGPDAACIGARLAAHAFNIALVRVAGIEPAQPVWKTGMLAVKHHTRVVGAVGLEPTTSRLKVGYAIHCVTLPELEGTAVFVHA